MFTADDLAELGPVTGIGDPIVDRADELPGLGLRRLARIDDDPGAPDGGAVHLAHGGGEAADAIEVGALEELRTGRLFPAIWSSLVHYLWGLGLGTVLGFAVGCVELSGQDNVRGRVISCMSHGGDETVLEVARENGIDIPGLCHMEGITDRGACRLCMVEIAGSPKLAAACMTKIAEGMDITAHSEKLLEYRQSITEMMFMERNHVCAVCVANNHCELQNMADELGLKHFDLITVGCDCSKSDFSLIFQLIHDGLDILSDNLFAGGHAMKLHEVHLFDAE